MSDNNNMIEKVEKITDRVGQFTPGREGPKLQASERSERLWGLFNEYSGLRKSRIKEALDVNLGPRDDETGKRSRNLRDLSREARDQIITDIGKDNLIQRLEGEITHLWQDPPVRSIFVAKVKESLREREIHEPSVKRYKGLKRTAKDLEGESFDLLRNQFLMRQMTPTLRAMDIARNRIESETVRKETEELETTGGMSEDQIEQRHGLDREHADLAALLAYERIKDYHDQFKKTGVTFTPSRLRLLEKVLEKTSNGTWMQLVGETGTGKTTFAKRASWVLNGEPAQYASGERSGGVRELLASKDIDPATERVFYQFGPLTAAITGCQNSIEMEEAIRDGRETTGKLLILDELNKFDQDALFGALKVPATLQPGELFNFKELPGVKLRMAHKGVAIVSTMNPATARYDRKELDPALDRLFYDGKEIVDYPPMTPQSPELYEIFLGILMDDNGRIRISKEELAPSFIEVEDGATGIARQELNPDVKKHGALYRFTLAASEIHKSFAQKENVAKRANDQGFLEKIVLEMQTLSSWISDYRSEIEGGISLSAYFEKKLNDFYTKIDSSNDRVIFERIFTHFGFDIQNPRDIPKPDYVPLTPIEMGYLTPKTPREVRRIGEEVVPSTKLYIDPESGEEINYLPTNIEIESDNVLRAGDVITQGEKKYRYIGIDAQTQEGIFEPIG